MELKGKKRYTDQIKEQEHLISFQKMVLDISFEFMNINQGNFDDKPMPANELERLINLIE